MLSHIVLTINNVNITNITGQFPNVYPSQELCQAATGQYCSKISPAYVEYKATFIGENLTNGFQQDELFTWEWTTVSTPPTPTPDNDDNNTSDNTTLIIAICVPVGIVIIVGIIVTVIMVTKMLKKKQQAVYLQNGNEGQVNNQKITTPI